MDHQTACSHCGESIDIDARFCRHCGSSDEDGWREDDEGLCDDDGFDYDAFVRDNLSGQLTNAQTRPLWRVVALVLLTLMALGYWLI